MNRRPPMTAQEHKAIAGVIQAMDTQQDGAIPGNVLLRATQLISARVSDVPRQFIVTLKQPSQPQGVTPWVQDFDGFAYVPGVSLFTAPGGMDFLRVALRWGAAGASFQTEFDYPSTGGVFGVTCDTLDIKVVPSLPVSLLPSAVPTVGAWYVEGQAADPTPLRWRELSTVVNNGASAAWSIKPYTRRVRVGLLGRPAAGIRIEFKDTSGAVLWTNDIDVALSVNGEALLEVPAHGAVMVLSNTSGAAQGVTVEWLAGLV